MKENQQQQLLQFQNGQSHFPFFNNRNGSQQSCHFCHMVGHYIAQCPFKKIMQANAQNNRKQNLFCSHCRKKGHTKDRCFILNPELRNSFRGSGKYNANQNRKNQKRPRQGAYLRSIRPQLMIKLIIRLIRKLQIEEVAVNHT